jgi:peptide/nickel transport system substrate-binding protein
MSAPLVCIAMLFSAAYGAPLVISQSFLAGSFDPTSGSTGWALTSHGISENLFTVNSNGVIVGQVAECVTQLDVLSWEVTLKADHYFSDGTPVTPTNVAAALQELNTENSNAQGSLGTMTVTALEGLKLKIQSTRATPDMASVLAEYPFVIYRKSGDNFIFTGPYAVAKFVKDEKIELIPNTYYPRAGERSSLTIKKLGGEAAASSIEAGELDMAFHIPVDTLPALRQSSDITVKSFLSGYQYMMHYNMRKSPLSDLKVRKAIDIALSRDALTQSTQGGRATRSFFPANTPYYLEEADLHPDKSGAEKLLDEAGWVLDGGIRKKDGAALTLRLVAYPQRPGLVMMQPVVKTTLESLGITVTSITTSAENWDELDTIMCQPYMNIENCELGWDLLMWAQHTMPAGDPQMFLNKFFRTDAGSNYAALASAEIDGLLDALSVAEVGDKRVTAAAAAHRAILAEVPVSILQTPSWHVAVHARLTDYTPWGSDYYVIRNDFGLQPLVSVMSYQSVCPYTGPPTPAPAPAPTPAVTTPAPTDVVENVNSAKQMTLIGPLFACIFFQGLMY